jgi:hypothetical protein
MPFFGLGLFIGDIEADAQVGPPSGGPDGVIQTEAEAFLQVEAGQFLAFD